MEHLCSTRSFRDPSSLTLVVLPFIEVVHIGVVGTGSLSYRHCSLPEGDREKRKHTSPEDAACLKAEDGPRLVPIVSVQSCCLEISHIITPAAKEDGYV